MCGLFIKSIVTGIKRRWKAGVAQAFSIVGAIWLIREIATGLIPSARNLLEANGTLYFIIIIVAALVAFLLYTYESRSVSFLVPTTDTRITIRYGDLLAEQTDWLIGVNEFFDSEIGIPVSPTSLHGKFIANIYNGNSTQFRDDLDRALATFPSHQTNRAIEPRAKFAIGTTAVLANGRHKVFLVAMAHTDLQSSKATSTVPLLWDALRGALQSISINGNGAPISLPLIGNGQSSVNIEPQHLLRLIVLALVDFGRKIGLPKCINIIVPEACFDLLDIREIKRDWRTK